MPINMTQLEPNVAMNKPAIKVPTVVPKLTEDKKDTIR